MAMVSRNVPPWAAVITIMPAVGGPSRTSVHSSGAKAAFVVMSCSRVPEDVGYAQASRAPDDSPHPPRVKAPPPAWQAGRGDSPLEASVGNAEATVRSG